MVRRAGYGELTKHQRVVKQMRLTLFRLFVFVALVQISEAQLGGFQCPMKGSPQIRQGDNVAASGGRFDSQRAAGKKAWCTRLEWQARRWSLRFIGRQSGRCGSELGQHGEHSDYRSWSGAYTVYGHLDSCWSLRVRTFKTGEKIGTVGYTGNASGLKTAGLPPHLHFALIQAGKSGLADANKPLRQMKAWGDYWQSLGAELTGAVDSRSLHGGWC